MECYETCVDVGKRCKFTLRKTSCCDCGKISASRNFAPSDKCCGCDKKQPCSSRSTCECGCHSAGSGCANPCNSCKEYRKRRQTCWEWLCSLFGFGGKKDEGLIGTANGPCSRSKSSSPCPPRSIGPKSNSFNCGACRPETLAAIKELKSKDYSAEYKEFKSPIVKRDDRPEEKCYDNFEKTKFWADCFKRPPPFECSSYSPAKYQERSSTVKDDYIPKAENSYQSPEKTTFSPNKIKPTTVTTSPITPSGFHSRARSRSRSKSPKPYLRKPKDSSNRSCSFTSGRSKPAASVSPFSKPLKRSSSMCSPCRCPPALCPRLPCDPCCPSRPCSPCPRVRSSSFNSGLRTRCCGPCVCSSCPYPCPMPLCPCPPGACPCPPAPCCPVRSRCPTPKSLCTCTSVCPKKPKKKTKACSRPQSLSPCAARGSSNPCCSPCPPCDVKPRGNTIKCPCKVISPHVYTKPKFCTSSSPPCCSTCVKPKPCSTKPCHKQQRICPKPVPCACRPSTLFPTSAAFVGVGRNYARSKEGDSLCKQLMAKYSTPSTVGYSSGKSFCCPSLGSGGCRSCLPCPAGGKNTVSACSPCFDYTYSRKPSPRNKKIKDSIEFNSFPNEKTPRLEFDLSHKIYSPCVRQRGPRSPTAEYLAKLSVTQISPGRGVARLSKGGLGDPASVSQGSALLKKKKGGKRKTRTGGGENVNNAAAETINNNRQEGWYSQHRFGEEEPVIPSRKTEKSTSRTSAWDRDGSSSIKGTTSDEYFGFFRRYLMISPVPFTFSEIVDTSLTTTAPTTEYAQSDLRENDTETPSAPSYPSSRSARPLENPTTLSASVHQKDHEHVYGNKKYEGTLICKGTHESNFDRPFHRTSKIKIDSKNAGDGRNEDKINGYLSPKSGYFKGLLTADKKDKLHFTVESKLHLETRKTLSTYPNTCDGNAYDNITKEHPHLLSVGSRKHEGSFLTHTLFNSETVSKVKDSNNLTSEKSDLKLIDLEVHNTDFNTLKIKKSAASSLEENRFTGVAELNGEELNSGDSRKRLEFGVAMADMKKPDVANVDRKKLDMDNVDRMVLDMINSETKDLDEAKLNGKELGKANKDIVGQKVNQASGTSFGGNISTRAESDKTDSQMMASSMVELERAQTMVSAFQKMKLGRPVGYVEDGKATCLSNVELKDLGVRIVERKDMGESDVDEKEWSVATMNGKSMRVPKMEGEELGGANLELKEMGVAKQLDVMQTHVHSNNHVLPVGKESSVDYEPDANMEACTILQLSPSSQRLNPLLASILEKCPPQNHILDGKESSVDIEPFEQLNESMVPDSTMANFQSEKRKSNPTPIFEGLFGNSEEPIEITIRTKESCGARNFSSAQYRNPKVAVNKEKKSAEMNKSTNKADESASGILSSVASTALDVGGNDSRCGGTIERSQTAIATCSQMTGTPDGISSVSSICSVSTVTDALSDVNKDAHGESSVDPVTSSVTVTSRSSPSVACDILRESSLTWQKVEDTNIEPWLIRNAKAAFMSFRNSGDSSGVANGRHHSSPNNSPAAAMSTDPTSPGSMVDVLKPLENCSSELGRLAASTSGIQDELNISVIRESGTPV